MLTDKSVYEARSADGLVLNEQQGSFVYALANPLCAPHDMATVITEFNSFCHRHGAQACWLMVQAQFRESYKDAGLSNVPIGSSAEIDVDKFITETVHNKWWRWKLNRATKNGYTYEALIAPQAAQTMHELRAVSDAWLKLGGHIERGFVMGSFDAEELAKQTIHIVRDKDGRIVAFANPLPTYHDHHTATIDLMRYTPEHSDVVAFLLHGLIHEMALQEIYTTFDLGFVPLARISENEVGKRVGNILQQTIRPIFSAHGLMQFKGKFDREWRRNYIAIDGDIITLSAALIALPKILQK